MNIDERLRESLHDNAPAGVSLWEGVQARSRQLDRHRHAVAGAALTATAVTTGLGLSLPLLFREPTLAPGASSSTSTRLVPLSYTIPDFRIRQVGFRPASASRASPYTTDVTR